MGVLRTVSLLQAKGFSEAPEQISCTDLPQQWRVPRRNSKGRSIQEVDWRSVREGGLSVPKMGRPKDCRLYPRNQQQQQAAQEELARNLLSDSPECLFARGLLSTLGQPYKDKVRPSTHVFAVSVPTGPFAAWIFCPPVRNHATTFPGCMESSGNFIF